MLLGSEVHLTMVAGNVITILDSLKAIFDSVLEVAIWAEMLTPNTQAHIYM